MNIINIPSAVGIVLFVLVLLLLSHSRGFKQSSYINLLISLSLVVISAFTFGLMTDFSTVYDVLVTKGAITVETAKQGKVNANLWAFAFPATTISIGANYLTGWFQSEKR